MRQTSLGAQGHGVRSRWLHRGPQGRWYRSARPPADAGTAAAHHGVGERQFIAVCDTAKTPGADQPACLRRLEDVLASIDNVIDKKVSI